MTTTGLFITDLPEGVTGRVLPNPAAPAATSDPTTLAVGEEGEDGEERGNDAPTTLAVGEEGEDDGDRERP